jgi:hypothetical protein
MQYTLCRNCRHQKRRPTISSPSSSARSVAPSPSESKRGSKRPLSTIPLPNELVWFPATPRMKRLMDEAITKKRRLITTMTTNTSDNDNEDLTVSAAASASNPATLSTKAVSSSSNDNSNNILSTKTTIIIVIKSYLQYHH